MPNVKNNAAAQETRRKLLEAAGEVFAERGLHAATIKQITDRAKVNSAAINYHFSDKFELYAATIRHALDLTWAPTPEQLSGPPEKRLRAFVAGIINDTFDRARPPWRTTLLAQEFIQPTAASDAVMEELIRPRADHIHNIARAILGPGATEEQVFRAGYSVAAQCFFYLYNREVLRRLRPQMIDDAKIQELVEHIVEFSLAALRVMRKQCSTVAARGRPGPHPGRGTK